MAGHDWRGTIAHVLAVVCFLSGILLSEFIARALANWSSWPFLSVAIGIEWFSLW